MGEGVQTVPAGGALPPSPSDQQPVGYISWSRIESLAECPRKYQLRYERHIEGEASGALIGGNVVHETIEAASGNPNLRGRWLDQEFERRLLEAVAAVGGPMAVSWGGRKTKKWPQGENLDWWLEMGPYMITYALAVQGFYEDSGFERVGSELTVRFMFHGYLVTSKIDELWRPPDGGPHVVLDYKTGRNKPGPLQGTIYALAVRTTLGVEVDRSEAVMLRYQERHWTEVEPFVDVIQEMMQGHGATLNGYRKAQFFPMSPSSFCASCNVWFACPYGSQYVVLRATEGDE